MTMWPSWFAQGCATAVAIAGFGGLCAAAGLAAFAGARKLGDALSWWPAYNRFLREVYLPEYRRRHERRGKR